MIFNATKKPVTIQAIQLVPGTLDQVLEFIQTEIKPYPVYVHSNGQFSKTFTEGDIIGVVIQTLEGPMLGKETDFIIKGVKGEFYACDAEIFALTYDYSLDIEVSDDEYNEISKLLVDTEEGIGILPELSIISDEPLVKSEPEEKPLLKPKTTPSKPKGKASAK